jgi:putative flavoprotein involved in K+ transport
MTTETIKTDTLVGAGQAGVAMSEHLSKLGVPHLVLERSRIAERWRTGRWDSLVANGPAWHDRFPGLEFDDVDPDGFAPKSGGRLLRSLCEEIQRADPHRRRGQKVVRNVGRPGFTVETSEGRDRSQPRGRRDRPFQRR